MLSLASTSDRAWVGRACAHLDEILLDHAHCEKKAASTAVSLLFKYAERRELLVTLSQLAREELGHFEQVLAQLAAHGVAFRHQVPSPYAGQLMKAMRAREPERVVDTLLCSALIEAPSCAHMRSPAGWVEPGQTPEFDEYTVVLKGLLRVKHAGGTFDVRAGQAVIARRGEWVQYSSPEPEGAEYVAVCVPAFSPETVHRDG